MSSFIPDTHSNDFDDDCGFTDGLDLVMDNRVPDYVDPDNYEPGFTDGYDLILDKRADHE